VSREDVDVGEIRHRVPVRDSAAEADLLTADVEADDARCAVDQRVHDLA
jgi:hypothetical protein